MKKFILKIILKFSLILLFITKAFLQDISISSETFFSEIIIDTFPFKIVHPPEGEKIPYVKSSFVIGQANPKGKLKINNVDTEIYPQTGGFLNMINYNTGQFTITAELLLGNTTYTIKRNIFVSPPKGKLPDHPLAIEDIKPDEDIILTPLNYLYINFRGTPNKQGTFSIQGIKKTFNIYESSPGSGNYEGSYFLQQTDNLKKAKIKITLKDNEKNKKISKMSKGTITLIQDQIPWIAEVKNDLSILRSGFIGDSKNKYGYIAFLPQGTFVNIVGANSRDYKLKLSNYLDLWINKADLREVLAKTSYKPAIAGSIKIINTSSNSLVQLNISEKRPYIVNQPIVGEKIDITFFNTISDTDWMYYTSTTDTITQVQWFQDETDVYRISIDTKKNSWLGYDTKFESNKFIIEFIKIPKLDKSSQTLKNFTIAVDAGHSPDTGAVGPTGLIERDVNMQIANKLAKILKDEGANAILIRNENEQVALLERTKIAWQNKVHIYISIHNNALPEGQNPLIKNGFGVYYFQPHSINLAKEIHNAFRDKFDVAQSTVNKLRDDGLYYANLAVTRSTQFPSVIVECAYIIVPREEALLKTEEFQNECAANIHKGIKNFLINMQTQ